MWTSSHVKPGGPRQSPRLRLEADKMRFSKEGESTAAPPTPTKSFDWGALDDDSDDDSGGSGGGTPAPDSNAEKKQINWESLDDDDDDDEEETESAVAKAGSSSIQNFDWDDDGDDEDDEEKENSDKEEGGGDGGGGGGMFDYLDALLSDDEEEKEEGGKKEGGIDWGNLSDEEKDDETRKRGDALKAKIFAALDEEVEAEAEFQKERAQKKQASQQKSTDSVAPKMQKARSGGMFGRSPSSMKMMKASKKVQTSFDIKEVSPTIPAYIVSYVKDVWLKENPTYEKTIKQGYLNKAGPAKRKRTFHRRWVVLTSTTVSYYEKFGDPEPKGSFLVELISSVRTVTEKGAAEDKVPVNLAFEVVTPSRMFLFVAETPKSQSDWIRTMSMISSKSKISTSNSCHTTADVLLEVFCQKNRKLIKVNLSLPYEAFRDKLIEKFLPMFPNPHELDGFEVFLPKEKVWLQSVLDGKSVSSYLATNLTSVQLQKK